MDAITLTEFVKLSPALQAKSEANLDGLIYLLHGLSIHDTESLYKTSSVNGSDLVEERNGRN
jgi:hypothetical protein